MALKSLALAAAVFVALVGVSYAGQINPMASAGAGQYALAVDTATALTAPTGAVGAQICVEAQAVRYRDDGVAPTATVGVPVAVGTCIFYAGPLSAVKFISQTAGAKIDASYYK